MKKLFLITAITFILTSAVFAQTEKDYTVELTSDNSGVIITAYNGRAAQVTVPIKIQGLPVKVIGPGAFASKAVMTRVIVQKGIIEIGDGAFQDCRGLASITLPEGLQKIGSHAFDSSGLTRIVIPQGCIDLGENLFANCKKLKEIILPRDLTTIPARMAAECELFNPLSLPPAIKSIGSRAFENCILLATVNIPNTVKSINIAEDAFEGCSKLPLAAQVILKNMGYSGSF